MRRLRTFRSGAFRLALLFSTLFALGAVTLFVAVTAAVNQYARHTTESALLDESALLRSEAQQRGRGALAQLIQRRERILNAREFLYLLTDPQGRRIVGDLPDTAAHVGWSEVSVPDAAEPNEPTNERAKVRTFGVRIGDGSLLAVGRNTYDLQELAEWLDLVTLWSGLGVILLALGGGFLIARVFLRRLDGVNDTLQRIMAGRLNERVPAVGMGDEYERLTTSLNSMLDRLEASMASLRQVSTDIAHDLRTPLARLRQHLESTRSLAGFNVALEGAIDGALAQVDQVLGTFHALLRIGQIEGGVGRSRFGRVDLSEVMERVRQAYAPTAEDRGRTLKAEITPELFIHGDSELLTQLFANLIENGLTHTGTAAAICVSLALHGGEVVATVADNGPGIPAQERGRVLHRFHRLDASRSTAGSGLGLALVAAIAELHGAKLKLSDNGPGLAVELTLAALLE